jgi:hypothetical protein
MIAPHAISMTYHDIVCAMYTREQLIRRSSGAAANNVSTCVARSILLALNYRSTGSD